MSKLKLSSSEKREYRELHGHSVSNWMAFSVCKVCIAQKEKEQKELADRVLAFRAGNEEKAKKNRMAILCDVLAEIQQTDLYEENPIKELENEFQKNLKLFDMFPAEYLAEETTKYFQKLHKKKRKYSWLQLVELASGYSNVQSFCMEMFQIERTWK